MEHHSLLSNVFMLHKELSYPKLFDSPFILERSPSSAITPLYLPNLPQWQKEVLRKNLLQVFQRCFVENIFEIQIVLWQKLHYNLCNPPVWGGSQYSMITTSNVTCPITVITSKGALAMLQSVIFFHGFSPTALPWEKLLCQFFLRRAIAL